MGDPETGNSMVVEVREPFERVLSLIVPLEPASSALMARGAMTLTSSEGHEVFVRPEVIVGIFGE